MLFVRSARISAGLTQIELAERTGLSQAAVSRLERPGANPTVQTLQRVLAATGHQLAVTPLQDEVDTSQIAERLKLTPAQRLATHTRSQRNLARLKASARRVAA
jgi:transcriptional regulator with XRE-family HTH domain